MMLACKLDEEKYDVTIYEKMNTIGRKFLVAGKGGFNLTHGLDIEDMIGRYVPSEFMAPFLNEFTNTNLRVFLYSLGIETFTGSSNRIFPAEGIKPIDVLEAFKKRMRKKGVSILNKHEFVDFKDQILSFKNSDGIKEIETDITVFAMGGGSWSKTGSDGKWLPLFDEKGIPTMAFEPSNCGLYTDWEEDFLLRHEGKPLKNISIHCGDLNQKGEAVITRKGLEGGAVYATLPEIRKQLSTQKSASIKINLKPALSYEEIENRISAIDFSVNVSRQLRSALKLSTTALGLIKTHISKEDFLNKDQLTKAVTGLDIEISGTASEEEAISTAGGLSLDAVDNHLMLVSHKDKYCIGEMLDWDAPTGGYLLQGCFSMGAFVAAHLNEI